MVATSPKAVAAGVLSVDPLAHLHVQHLTVPQLMNDLLDHRVIGRGVAWRDAICQGSPAVDRREPGNASGKELQVDKEPASLESIVGVCCDLRKGRGNEVKLSVA